MVSECMFTLRKHIFTKKKMLHPRGGWGTKRGVKESLLILKGIQTEFQGTMEGCAQGYPHTYKCVSSYMCPFLSTVAIEILKLCLTDCVFINGTQEHPSRAWTIPAEHGASHNTVCRQAGACGCSQSGLCLMGPVA